MELPVATLYLNGGVTIGGQLMPPIREDGVHISPTTSKHAVELTITFLVARVDYRRKPPGNDLGPPWAHGQHHAG